MAFTKIILVTVLYIMLIICLGTMSKADDIPCVNEECPEGYVCAAHNCFRQPCGPSRVCLKINNY
ncbi:hypothetical protein C0J52_22178 [Blattella germanica]|nr:hypothetical protein C0J52_22178 [Blattella germanica]